MNDLTYGVYNKKSLVVRGDRDKYQKILKTKFDDIRWNSRMKGGAGWLLPLEKEDALKEFVATLLPVNETKSVDSIEEDNKPHDSDKKTIDDEEDARKEQMLADLDLHVKSTKNQVKYRRGHDSDSDSSDSNSGPSTPSRTVLTATPPIKKQKTTTKESKNKQKYETEVKEVVEPKRRRTEIVKDKIAKLVSKPKKTKAKPCSSSSDEHTRVVSQKKTRKML